MSGTAAVGAVGAGAKIDGVQKATLSEKWINNIQLKMTEVEVEKLKE